MSKFTDLANYSRSREYIEQEPSKFVYMFLLLVLISIAVVISFAFKFDKEITVSAPGMIVIEDKIVVSSVVTGIITEVALKDGQTISEGDLLFKIDSSTIIDELEYLNEQLKNETDIVVEQNNYINEQIDNLKSLVLLSNRRMEEVESEIINYETYLDAINSRLKNPFYKEYEEKSKYYYEFELYRIRYKTVRENDYYNNTDRLEEKEREIDRIISEEKVRVFTLIDSFKTERDSIETKLVNFDEQLLMLMKELDSKTNDIRLNELQSQIDTMENQLIRTEVYATQDGIVHIKVPLDVGSYVSAGRELIEIFPIKKNYAAYMYIPNQDIMSIQDGQDVKFEFTGSSSQKNKYYFGYVSKISETATIIGNESAYLVEVDISNELGKDLFSKGELRSGINISCKVIVDKQKVIYWLLDKLDFLTELLE